MKTENIYGQAYIKDVTSAPGATPGLKAELGYGATSDPSSWTVWVSAGFNVQAGNNDEFVATLTPISVGNYNYAYRYSYNSGDYTYCDLNGPIPISGGGTRNFGLMFVTGPIPAPEPGILILLGISMMSVAGLRRWWKA